MKNAEKIHFSLFTRCDPNCLEMNKQKIKKKNVENMEQYAYKFSYRFKIRFNAKNMIMS